MQVETNFTQVVKKLREFDKAIAKQTNQKLRAVAVEAVGLAQARAAWSKQIPPLIKPTVTQRGAGIRVAAKPTPIGVLNERNKGEWRHPVFGNTAVWVTQKTHSSVRPVIEEESSRLKTVSEEIIAAAKREAGL